MAPFSFIKTIEKEDLISVKISINEVKISKDKSVYLGLGNMDSLYTGTTLHNLLYWRELLYFSNGTIHPSRVHLEHFQQRYH